MKAYLFDTSGNPFPNKEQNDPQHQQMAKTYVTGIAQTLDQYADNQNITLHSGETRNMQQYCEDLVWAGLDRTPAYKAMAADPANAGNIPRIEKTIAAENSQTLDKDGKTTAGTSQKGCPPTVTP